jgi:hypothetical protein
MEYALEGYPWPVSCAITTVIAGKGMLLESTLAMAADEAAD